jgi:hypothetical protein
MPRALTATRKKEKAKTTFAWAKKVSKMTSDPKKLFIEERSEEGSMSFGHA